MCRPDNSDVFICFSWDEDETWCSLGSQSNPTFNSLALSSGSGGCLTSTHIVMLCNLSWAGNVIFSPSSELEFCSWCVIRGFGWTKAFVLPLVLTLVMGLLVQMGVGRAEGWQSYRNMESVHVSGGEVYMHSRLDCPEGLISKQQGRD